MLVKEIYTMSFYNGTGGALQPGRKNYFPAHPKLLNNIVKCLRVVAQDQGALGVQDAQQIQLAVARRVLVTLVNAKGETIYNRIPLLALESTRGKQRAFGHTIDATKSYFELVNAGAQIVQTLTLECTL